ncbi:cytochrome oxidase putative small subunit CydP [Legionella parisiensis]|uniref:cytochrome oxidase putative small subunit CydP n=1 Tax=Legionella parisiensis TaxID=45071 RepID=UPI000B25B2C7|nr:cytochrome oxidase putative small subunit CydP [Legionella parisiensis]
MIKPLTRDILITLIIKFSLLILLWLICFKDVRRSHQSNEQWLLGTSQQKIHILAKEK